MDIQKVRDVKKKYEGAWIKKRNVVAVGIGNTRDGRIGVIISVKKLSKRVLAQFPDEIDMVPIELNESGEIKAF
ncbi:MAG: hypothetical protein AB7T22_14790 [Calditrichaceae bacterium]